MPCVRLAATFPGITECRCELGTSVLPATGDWIWASLPSDSHEHSSLSKDGGRTWTHHVQMPSEGGWYAAGALITRAVQFAPQFVVLSAFAALTDPERSRRVVTVAGTKVAAIGLSAVAVLALVGPWLVPAVLGAGFDRVGRVAWLYALLGTLLAVNQLLVAQRVARHDESIAWAVWTATVLLGVVVLGGVTHGIVSLVTAVLVVNVVLAAGLVWRLSARP